MRAKLIHKRTIMLPAMRYVTSIYGLFWGLMFASAQKVRVGMCLVLPVHRRAWIHMLFCFYSYEVLFVNSKMQVVDKAVLQPWRLRYVPRAPCMYVIEGWPGTFKGIQIGDRVKIDVS